MAVMWLLALSLPAFGQDLKRAVPGAEEPFTDLRGMSVTDRAHPGYDPLGIRIGSFVLYPALDVAGSYNDNIFATDVVTVSDYIIEINPSIDLVSNWSNHVLNLFASGSIFRYADNPSEDRENYEAGADGRIDFTRDVTLDLLGQFEHLTEERGSPNDVGGFAPTQFNLVTGEAAYTQTFNRLTVAPFAKIQYYDFDDTPALGGVINNDDRDRLEMTAGMRADYELTPDVAFFVLGKGNFRDYQTVPDDSGLIRNSHGFNLVAGAALDFTGSLFGDIYVGYLSQYYDDPALITISGVNAGIDMTWNVTPLTSVTATAQRRIEETIQAGASGFLATQIGIAVDHELLRNLILHAEIIGRWDDYQGITREDNYIDAGVSGQYLMNRYLRFELSYAFTQRDSNVAGDDYARNIVMARFRVQY